MSEVKITNAKKISGSGSLMGFFDVELPSGLVIRGASLLQKDGDRWIGLPRREWAGQDGRKNYAPVIEFASKDARERFQKAVLPLAETALGVARS
jgi:DNA-binding cell septation regulator SpoVG